MTTQPIIGVNCDFRDAKGGTPGFGFVSEGYFRKISLAGGVPILIPILDCPEQLDRVLDIVDGVVLVGGGDLDPRNDGFMLHHTVNPMSPVREGFDRMLCNELFQRRIPTFGIGVGMQLLNLTCGGNLFLDIATDIPNAIRHRDNQDITHRHTLNIDSDSILSRVYGEGEIRVLSRHHMAIDELAPGFRVTARCPDGVVEAIESEMVDWFAMGTQFHPESVYASALDIRIFEEFIEGTRQQSGKGGLRVAA